MDLGLKGKVAIVCAASKGIGRACALELAREGCSVAICSRNGAELNTTAVEISRKTGAEIFSEQCDVTDKMQSSQFVDKVSRKFGAVHILVNNCGGPPPGRMEDFMPEDYYAGLERSLMAAIQWTYLVVDCMKKQKWGRIVNITSSAVKEPIYGLIQSNTARAGLTGFMKSAATELAAYGILVNNVLPGRIDTDRLRESFAGRAKKSGRTPKEELKASIPEIPIGRLGSPEEISALVAFLCSEKNSYITGASIQVDGGLLKGLL